MSKIHLLSRPATHTGARGPISGADDVSQVLRVHCQCPTCKHLDPQDQCEAKSGLSPAAPSVTVWALGLDIGGFPVPEYAVLRVHC